MKKTYLNYLFIAIGAFVLAFGLYNFNYQNEITEGGVLGLILLFKHLFNISPSITSILIDISLFILGVKFFGKSFLFRSLFCTFIFSMSYAFLESHGFQVQSLTNNLLLASVISGIFVGSGVGLVVVNGGAAGGDDVLALLANRFLHLKVQQAYIIFDVIVLILSLSYLSYNEIFFSLIAVTISGALIGKIYHY